MKHTLKEMARAGMAVLPATAMVTSMITLPASAQAAEVQDVTQRQGKVSSANTVLGQASGVHASENKVIETQLLKDEAADALATANEALAKAQEENDEARAQEKNAAAALDAANEALEKATTAAETARLNYETSSNDLKSAQAAATEARNAAVAAQESLSAAQEKAAATEKAAKVTSLDFFEAMGAQDAIDAINNASKKDFTRIGNYDDATHIENMRAAIQWLGVINDIRMNEAGFTTELKVTDLLMAQAQSNANYSDTVIAHASQWDNGENLAWNSRNNPAADWKESGAFYQWYTGEKNVFDTAVDTMTGNDSAGYTVTWSGGSFAVNASQAAELRSIRSKNQATNSQVNNIFRMNNDFFSKVGHYLNVINTAYACEGFAINTATDGKDANGSTAVSRRHLYTYSNVLSYGRSDGTQYSVAEYTKRFNDWYDKMKPQLATKEDVAAAYEDVKNAETVLATAQGAAEKTAAAVNTAQKRADDAARDLEDAVASQGAAEKTQREATAAKSQAAAKAMDAANTLEQAQAKAADAQNRAEDADRQAQVAASEEAVVSIGAGASYSGAAVEPAVAVEYAGTVLEQGTDYTVEYSNNVNAGVGTVTISGIGDFAGSVTENFAIDKAKLTARYVSERIACDQVPAASVLVTGFVNGESADTAAGYVAPKVDVAGKKAGTHSIVPAGGAADNYFFEYEAGSLDVSHARVEADSEVAATCDHEGLTEGAHCAACGEVTEAQQPVGKLAHAWGEWTVVTEATATAAGVKSRVCSACGETETAAIPTAAQAEATANEEAIAQGFVGTAETVGTAITAAASDEGPKGTEFNALQAKAAKVTKSSVKVTWKRVTGASKYLVYGNKCGKGKKYQLMATSTGSSYTKKSLKKGTYHKFMVVAVDSENRVISVSKTIHAATSGGKVGNAKSVKTAAKKNKLSLKKGKTFKLKAKAVAASSKLKVKKHRSVAYETSNAKVATVSSSGKVKAVGKGSCYVYAYAQNGVFAKVKVTVK